MVDQIREANLKARLEAEEKQRRIFAEKQELRQRELTSKEMEQRNAMELQKQKLEAEKKEREIRRICESSEELNELERKLRTAYVDKERAAQHQEAMLIRKLENDREQAIEERMEYDRQQDFHRQQESERKRRQYLSAQRDVLQQQIRAREEDTKRMKEETMKENKLVDDIIKKINMEDELEREQRMNKVDETRALVLQHQFERTMQMKAIEEEERRQDSEIQAYNTMMKERYQKEDAEKKRKELEKKKLWENVVDKTQSEIQVKEEYATLRSMLWEEEHEAKLKKEEAETINRQMKLREEMLRENKAQISAKRELLEKMEQEEQELVRQMLHKFSQDEDVERRKEENRRLFKQRFMAEANKQRLDRDMILQQERERDMNEQAAQRKREEQKQQIIDHAKRLLLEKHCKLMR